MRELLNLYDQQLRGLAEVADASELVRIGPLWAATFPARGRGFISYEPLDPDTDLAWLVAEAKQHYERDPRVTRVEWKLRDHDQLPGLVDLLGSHGFALQESETVMVGEVAQVIAAADPLPAGYSLHRAHDESELREAEELAGQVFGDGPEESIRLADQLVARMRTDPDSFEMWFVRDPTGQVVCSGRVDPVPGTDFAGLWGGACHPEHRGRGLYRALTAARARSAQARGHRLLQSDCTEYSRPILQRAGLVAITTTTPALWWRDQLAG
ncbi:GNAT family N-acetyltransferase [Luteococcus peritonei]|uniref:GNAT family N-acetyltransferase n=1 Tax=Luteococcus peritonei TaxID=88874 RepID=A0ABW4RZD5_9ACTN